MAFLVDFSSDPEEPSSPSDQSYSRIPAFPSAPEGSAVEVSAPVRNRAIPHQPLITYHESEAEHKQDSSPSPAPPNDPQSDMAFSPVPSFDSAISSCFPKEPEWSSVFDSDEPISSLPTIAMRRSSPPPRRLSLGLQPKPFPFREKDYCMNSKKLLGTGIWSSVHLAKPIGPTAHMTLTPPPSPTFRRDSSLDVVTSDSYAIKVPVGNAARGVLTTEAAILSYLNCLPLAEKHVVTFHGQDSRNGALVLEALPLSLENYMERLGLLSETERAEELADVFPSIALECVKGLQFLHSAGVIHSDIKPSNILLRPLKEKSPSGKTLYQPLFADFSSSFRPAAIDSTATAAQKLCPLGGGSWDFLAPVLLNPSRPAEPSPQTDVHALAIALLSLIIGHSPFLAAGVNSYIRREMIKQGRAMDCVIGDVDCSRRLRNLEVALQWTRGNVQEWLEEGLWKCTTNNGIESSKWVKQLKERI